MQQNQQIPLTLIDPPLLPARIDSLSEGLEELIEDIRKRGQLQNIGVVDTHDGRYRLVWGSRRCAALEEMGAELVRGDIYERDEIDEMEATAAENTHRTNLNPVEEGEFYASFMAAKQITVAECARRVGRSPHTVSRMLSFVAGDAEVKSALRGGFINSAQAEQLNQIADDIGRRQGLTWARTGLMTAIQIKNWREHREVYGISDSMQDVKEALESTPTVDMRTMVKCQLHLDFVDMTTAPPRVICDECMNLIADLLTERAQTLHQHAGQAGAAGQ